jgi:hypothetical protein
VQPDGLQGNLHRLIVFLTFMAFSRVMGCTSEHTVLSSFPAARMFVSFFSFLQPRWARSPLCYDKLLGIQVKANKMPLFNL